MLSAEGRALSRGEEGIQISRKRRGLRSRRGSSRRVRWEVQPLTQVRPNFPGPGQLAGEYRVYLKGHLSTGRTVQTDLPFGGSSPTVCPKYISKPRFQGLLWGQEGKGDSTDKAPNLSSYTIHVQ